MAAAVGGTYKRGLTFMTSSLEGGRGPKKKQTTERNQLILVCDKACMREMRSIAVEKMITHMCSFLENKMDSRMYGCMGPYMYGPIHIWGDVNQVAQSSGYIYLTRISLKGGTHVDI